MPKQKALSSYRRKFDHNVPNWIASRVSRWMEFFGLREWSIKVSMLPQEKLAQADTVVSGSGLSQTAAYTQTDTPYLNAEMSFSEALSDGEAGRATVFHEVRHIYYDKHFAQWVVDHLIDQFVPPHRRMEMVSAFGEKIETLIEHDVYQFEQLTSL